jgi:hypothetical protein
VLSTLLAKRKEEEVSRSVAEEQSRREKERAQEEKLKEMELKVCNQHGDMYSLVIAYILSSHALDDSSNWSSKGRRKRAGGKRKLSSQVVS